MGKNGHLRTKRRVRGARSSSRSRSPLVFLVMAEITIRPAPASRPQHDQSVLPHLPLQPRPPSPPSSSHTCGPDAPNCLLLKCHLLLLAAPVSPSRAEASSGRFPSHPSPLSGLGALFVLSWQAMRASVRELLSLSALLICRPDCKLRAGEDFALHLCS